MFFILNIEYHIYILPYNTLYMYIYTMQNYLLRITSLFSEICKDFIFREPLKTANILNHDLGKIRQWVEQRKMVFNSHPTKQPQEIFFF